MNYEEINLSLQDEEWPLEYTDHDRHIVRAIVFDDDGYFYFVRAQRDDDFGKATLIETSGGGVEDGEDLQAAIHRELREELGAEIEILGKIGVVEDYYNLIHRHNINNYFICKIISFGEKNLTQDEIECFHLSTLKLTYEEAIKEYERCSVTKIGRLVANREVPVLRHARKLLGEPYSIREIKENEYQVLHDFLYEAIFIPEGVDPPEQSILSMPELQVYVSDFGKQKDDICFVTLVNERIVGAVWVRVMNDYGHIEEGVPSFAISLYKEYRGQGIGTALMKRMLMELKSRGYEKASLSVQKANYAVRMYRKVGFEIYEENEEEYLMVCYLKKEKII